jgi:hypothetical protein
MREVQFKSENDGTIRLVLTDWRPTQVRIEATRVSKMDLFAIAEAMDDLVDGVTDRDFDCLRVGEVLVGDILEDMGSGKRHKVTAIRRPYGACIEIQFEDGTFIQKGSEDDHLEEIQKVPQGWDKIDTSV